MAPFQQPFQSEELPDRIQFIQKTYKEKRRKGGRVDLNKCELMEIVQYTCNPPDQNIPNPGVVTCKPIVRLFRRCAGGLTVETTAWEKRMKGEQSTTVKPEKSLLSYLDDSQYTQYD